jgi:hypothetical protein
MLRLFLRLKKRIAKIRVRADRMNNETGAASEGVRNTEQKDLCLHLYYLIITNIKKKKILTVWQKRKRDIWN